MLYGGGDLRHDEQLIALLLSNNTQVVVEAEVEGGRIAAAKEQQK